MAGSPQPRFGMLLAQYRRSAGYTQEALAALAGLSARGIQDLERGVSRVPRRDTLGLLTAALGLSGDEQAALQLAAQQVPGNDAGRELVSHTPEIRGPVPPAPLAPLVGREHELLVLDRFLTVSESYDQPPLLLYAGEPGIGKTRLLQTAAQIAVKHGWCVLSGGCYRSGGEQPFSPLLEAVTRYLHALSPARRRIVLTGCAWLVRLLPELAEDLEPLPTVVVSLKQERRLLCAAIARLLNTLAGPSGTLLILDDLQWAGPDALELLAMLLRTPLSMRLCVLGAYRNTEVQSTDPLGLLLADLVVAGLAQQETLGPLEQGQATEMLHALLSGVSSADSAGSDATLVLNLLERAGGIPFYLMSYAQSLRTGTIDTNSVPWNIFEGVRQRLAPLQDSVRQLIGVAAVVGRCIPWTLLVQVADQPEEEVLNGIEAACRARLLLEQADGTYAFAHDLIREVVETDLGAARRAVLHRRVGEALERDAVYGSPELLAYHFDRSGSMDKAVHYMEQAGDLAWSQRAYGAAEQYYQTVLDRQSGHGSISATARAREKLGEVLIQTGRYDAALQILEPVVSSLRATGDLAALGRMAARVAWLHGQHGTTRQGFNILRPVLDLVERHGDPTMCAAPIMAHAQLLVATGQYEASLAAAERVSALASEDDLQLKLAADAHRINLLQLQGRLGDALQLSRELIPILEVASDVESLLRTIRDTAWIHALQGALATSKTYMDQALGIARQLEDAGQIMFTLAMRGWITFVAGDARSARADLDQSLEICQRIDTPRLAAYLQLFRAHVLAAIDCLPAARAAGEEATALARAADDYQAHRLSARALAEIDILEGQPDLACARLAPLLDRDGLQECDVTLLLPVLAWAYLENRQVEQAIATIDQAIMRSRREAMRLVLVEALRVQALIALWQDDLGRAARSLEEGLALAQAMPYPYAEARLMHMDGLLHIRRGGARRARERLEAARRQFRSLHASIDVARVEAELHGMEHRPEHGVPPITDAQWNAIAALLPARGRARGRPRADDRRLLQAMLYKHETRCAWAEVPAELGDGATAHRRWKEWQAGGLWEEIMAVTQRTGMAAEKKRSVEPTPYTRQEAGEREHHAFEGGDF